ncbi:hypothetical protein AB3Z09_04120 [Companilactobacillus farciminis]|uniref:hypothetical protein n=1 Tax=Companilactobacillus farciminis TaxID=1612 RepID=UPI0034D72872
MKKSIKYAGIAAATLLAVAPVAAPVVSQADTATTQAVGNTDSDTLTSQAQDFKDQFGDITADDTTATHVANLNGYFDANSAVSIANFNSNSNVVALMKSQNKHIELAMLNNKNVKVYLTATDASGKTYDSSTTVGNTAKDLATAMGLDNKMPVTITMHLVGDNLDSNFNSKFSEISFKINKDTDNELKTVNAQFTTPISVAKNSKTLATQLVNTNDVTLDDQDGNSLAVKAIAYGDKYYSTYDNAISAAKGNSVTPTKDVDGGEFKTAGTYYQTVTYTAVQYSALSSFITAYANQNTVDPDYNVYVNGKQASTGVDFVADAGSNAKGILPSITFVRAINVSDSEAQWTVTDNKGVVTTKSDTPYYTLVNDNGDKIANRALAKNSAWITDQKRVDQNGNTQYRVATGEWIDANNVTFSDKATTDEGAYTDEQALNGKVTLDGPSSFVYFLYNDNGEQISSRALSGDSAWFTDKKATNAAGVTVYHVATGEWVQAGNGVNYSAY